MTGRTHTSLTLALTLLNAGRLQECLDELDRCPDSTTLTPELIRLRGDALVRLARWKELDVLVDALPADDALMRSLATVLRSKSEFLRGHRDSALARLASAEFCGDPSIDALHLRLKGMVEARLGCFSAAVTSLRAAVSEFERTRDRLGIADSLNGLVLAERMMARHDVAESCFQRAYELASDAGSIREMATSSLNLGSVHLTRGRLISAGESFERALAMAREVGANTAATWALLGLGLVTFRRGRTGIALRQLVAGLAESRKHRWLRHQAAAHEYLAEFRLSQGRYDVARRHLRRAIRIGRALGDPQAQFEPQYRLAEAELGLGNAALARSLAVEARDDFAGRGDRLEAAFAARVAAQALLCLGDGEVALRELEEIRATLDELGEQFEIHRVDRLLRATLANTSIVDIRLEERSLPGDGTGAEDETDAESAAKGADKGSGDSVAERADRVRGRADQPDGQRSTPRSSSQGPRSARRMSSPPPVRGTTPRSRTSSRLQPTLVYGVSQVFLDFVAEVDLHAPESSFLLLEGETGVGKELIARRIHELSPRGRGNFVPFNCGTSTPDLFDAELFGHVRGAYTGAESGRLGLARMADGGTLLLDEIGELARLSQARLLRFLDTGEVRPVGSDTIAHADVRVISATHQDLDRLVAQGEFRRDLFFRLNPIRLRVPPLRERLEDLEILVRYFLEVDVPAAARTVFPDAVLAAMSRYEWPGNVRELRNEVLKIVRRGAKGRVKDWTPPTGTAPSPDLELRTDAGSITREALESALRRTAGRPTPTAQILGVQRMAVYRLAEKFGIDIAAFRS